MNKIRLDKQEAFFDCSEHQYNTDLIINPPFHTKNEISIIIERLKRAGIEKNISDFGSGSGRVTIPLLKQNFSVLAVDISTKSLENLKKIAKSLSLKGLETTHNLPKGKKFKAIVGADILHHISIDTYLPMFYESLEEGGRVIFSEPGAFNISWYIYLPLVADWEVERGVMRCSYHRLKTSFEKYGFRNVQVMGLGLFPRPFLNFSKRLCLLNDRIGNLPFLRLFAYRYIVYARK